MFLRYNLGADASLLETRARSSQFVSSKNTSWWSAYEHACHGRIPAHKFARKKLFARGKDDISSSCVFKSEVDQPFEISIVTPAFIQELVQDELDDATGVLITAFVMADKSLDYLL